MILLEFRHAALVIMIIVLNWYFKKNLLLNILLIMEGLGNIATLELKFVMDLLFFFFFKYISN